MYTPEMSALYTPISVQRQERLFWVPYPANKEIWEEGEAIKCVKISSSDLIKYTGIWEFQPQGLVDAKGNY